MTRQPPTVHIRSGIERFQTGFRNLIYTYVPGWENGIEGSQCQIGHSRWCVVNSTVSDFYYATAGHGCWTSYTYMYIFLWELAHLYIKNSFMCILSIHPSYELSMIGILREVFPYRSCQRGCGHTTCGSTQCTEAQ